MASTTEQDSTPVRLDNWKALAQYLGRCTRTVQRWHSKYGLPVRHLGGESGSVFAFTDELDDWLRERGRSTATKKLSAPLRPAALQDSTLNHDSDGFSAHPTLDGQRNRASSLVALAQKMRENPSHANLGDIARLYRKAIEFDPMNAGAWAGLSLSLVAQGLIGSLHPLNAYEPARAALRRAIEINPDLLEVVRAEAWLKMLVDRDWKGARDRFDAALLQCRSNAPTLVGRSILHISEGSMPEAHSLLLEALSYWPLSTAVVTILCWHQYLAGRPEAAIALITQARAGGHYGAILDAVEALSLIRTGKPGDCIPYLESLIAESPRHHTLRGVLGYAYGVTGRIQDARDALEILTEPGLRGEYDYAYPSALTLLGLNQSRRAMECLERSYHHGSLWSLGFHSDPILEPLHTDPHFTFIGKFTHS